MKLPRRRRIVSTDVSITSYDEVLAAIDAAIDEPERIYVCCTPASSLMFARRDRRLASALADADIVTPDGMGVVYAARLLGEQIEDRVYGPDLMLMQLERAAARGTATYFYGGHDQRALDELIGGYKERFPDLVVAGSWSPPHRSLTQSEDEAAIERINSSGAEVVWVGIGSPKQELWMHEHRAQLSAAVLLGVGAAFDFHAGRVAQAPDWMQNRGLEWLFRVAQDPLRLGRRYLATLPHFAALVLLQRVRG